MPRWPPQPTAEDLEALSWMERFAAAIAADESRLRLQIIDMEQRLEKLAEQRESVVSAREVYAERWGLAV